jgi:hypothetical protein
MRRIPHLVLALSVALLPVQGFAAKKVKKRSHAAEVEEAAETERAQSAPRKRRHKAQPKVIDVAQPAEEQPAQKAAADAPVAVEEPDDEAEDDSAKWMSVLSSKLPPRRYAYVVGAVLAGLGLVFAYQAQGEAKRAETITSAVEAQAAVQNARGSAALANVMYGLAAAAALTALILEFLPEPAADKSVLTFHF